MRSRSGHTRNFQADLSTLQLSFAIRPFAQDVNGEIAMKYWFLALLLLFAGSSQAITWTFAEGDKQGWGARESFESDNRNRIAVRDTVVAGVWRLVPRDSISAVELVSPVINHDSALFDSVKIRLRVVHSAPTEGWVVLRWTNARNLLYPGFDPPPVPRDRYSTFSQKKDITYSTDWQEITIANLSSGQKSWEGELRDIRTHLIIYDKDEIPPAERAIDCIEIDEIVLTGEKERAKGVLPVPSVDINPARGRIGKLFAPSSFYPIVLGFGTHHKDAAVFADVDKDGDQDIVAYWDHVEGGKVSYGWVTALNDGDGRFGLGVEHVFPAAESGVPIPQLKVGDIAGDGVEELVTAHRNRIKVLSMAESLDGETLFLMANRWFLDVADVDGDGDGELVLATSGKSPQVEIWDCADKRDYRRVASWEMEGYMPHFVGDLIAGNGAEILWIPSSPSVLRSLVRYDLEWRLTTGFKKEARAELAVPVQVNMSMVRYIGDIDSDGNIDLVTSNVRVFDDGDQFQGLTLWKNDGSGKLDKSAWYDETVWLMGQLEAWDLDKDGVVAPVFINTNPRLGYSVVVAKGQRNTTPTPEGWYPISGSRGGKILSGDIDNDEDLDLAVLDHALGGIHILRNLSAERKSQGVVGESDLEGVR